MSVLVIVESPTKARTIRNFLPSGYQVEASMGHIRDLPQSATEIPAELKKLEWSRLGVNVEADFEPLYIVPKDKQKVVKELRQALKNADELILATDEDREGESISWHLLEVLQPKVPTRRMVFHEITREAIQRALAERRDIDYRLVHAQETRRILDRLVGYTLSPLLWKKIAPKLSAGRVQSVAVKLLVEREQARRAFKKASYWDLKADLNHAKAVFPAELVTLAGQRLASGRDFDSTTGNLIAGREVVRLDETTATALRDRLDGKPWQVTNVEERAFTRKPSPPFTTSTLQQEANRKLRFPAQVTMRLAQRLYEEGYITYMRTDSVHLSEQAITAARACVQTKYGKEYLSPEPRQYKTKSKGAQEAHEAIRPSGEVFRLPLETGLSGDLLALYELIWKRTIASQMAEARLSSTIVTLQVEDAEFRASGKRIDFPGFIRAYVEGSDDPEAALDDKEVNLPLLRQGDQPRCQSLSTAGHETQPPDRYSEAALVKALESEGIGRPSTYASIIGTIKDRGYAQQLGNALVPTYTAFAVTGLLQEHFPRLVDTHFTARMETTLDHIADGDAEWLRYLREFFLGDEGLDHLVKVGAEQIEPAKACSIHLEGLDAEIRIGKYGPYVHLAQDEKDISVSLPPDVPPAELNPEHIEQLIHAKLHGPEQIATFPDTNEPIYALVGPYGPYVQLGQGSDERKPKRVSLPKGLALADVTAEIAISLLRLPRHLGEHPATGKAIKAGLGRFGPYVVCDGDYRSLKVGDNVLTIDFERALELLSQPKQTRGTATPLKVLGAHPADNEPVAIYSGRYGPYVKHGDVNATLPKDSVIEVVTLEDAIALLESRGKATKTKTKTTKATTTKTTKTTIRKRTGTDTTASDMDTSSKSTSNGTRKSTGSSAKTSTNRKTTSRRSTSNE